MLLGCEQAAPRGTAGGVRIGCSGWSYRDWRGTVYPSELAASGWVAAYAKIFDTVELNTTIYRLPRPATVQQWATEGSGQISYDEWVHQLESLARMREPRFR